MIAQEIQNSLLAAIKSLHEASREHESIPIKRAEAEFHYRQARAKTFTQIMGDVDGKKPTDKFIEAQVDLLCADQMHAVRMAEAGYEVSTQQIMTLKTEISAYQSLLAVQKAEMELHT